ncbi:protein-disulfide isomerase [Arthrobacter sp. AQ5-05]|uniref:DsbA family protein n=1 Tax=Arthrobacter sp. AQ5-05 TaxID=2184581 RepID=UPI000DCC3C65|nr:thioredoxin domain-containing protein [Arthrobacter sp. AQ5-05]RAX49075.1 protein-disulfide isomerase [Arthrobacter sp. AQ5-05]
MNRAEGSETVQQIPENNNAGTENRKPAPERGGKPGTRRKFPWLWVAPIPVALAIGLLIGAQLPVGDRDPGPAAPAAATQNPGSQAPGQNANAPAPAFPDVARLEVQDPTALGDVNAPVVMVAFTDFQCPYCAKWTESTLPELIGTYIDQGKLRIEWRDLDLFGDASLTAAHAAQAAAMQGSYVAFHARMAEGGTIAPKSAYSATSLKATAEDLGLDGEQFLVDMDSKQAKDAVKRNLDEAQELAVMSTPVFLINQMPFVGAQPLENFVAAIDAELQQAEAGRQ